MGFLLWGEYGAGHNLSTCGHLFPICFWDLNLTPSEGACRLCSLPVQKWAGKGGGKVKLKNLHHPILKTEVQTRLHLLCRYFSPCTVTFVINTEKIYQSLLICFNKIGKLYRLIKSVSILISNYSLPVCDLCTNWYIESYFCQ